MGERQAGAMTPMVAQADVFTDAIVFVFDNASFVGDKTVEHLVLSGSAIAVSLLLAIPLGVWLGHLHRGSFLAISVGNLGRALPSLAVIAFGLPVFGISFTNVLVSLVVLAVPPMLTNAYTAVDGVESDAVEAARGMGMSGTQILVRVELPLALSLVFAGIRTSSVYVIATATIAAIAGGGGLGDIIVNQASYGFDGVIGAALCVSLLALTADLLLALVQRAVTPAALRGTTPGLEPDLAPRTSG
ncbi:MAG: ABC transporter permease [Gaiellaceae bacterium]